ncbi:hypothetical protein JCM6882_009054 [Rhodosporidiobolus microsporus]
MASNTLPPLRAPLEQLQVFTPWGLACTSLIPFTSYDLSPHIPHYYKKRCPPWTRELEAWFQLFHPAVWPILEADDTSDVSFGLSIEERIEKLEAAATALAASGTVENADEVERRDRTLKDLRWTVQLVLVRRFFRWTRIYALFAARSSYLAWHRVDSPSKAAYDIMLWPLPTRFNPSTPYSLPPDCLPDPPEPTYFPYTYTLGIFLIGHDMRPFVLPDQPSLAAERAWESLPFNSGTATVMDEEPRDPLQR